MDRFLELFKDVFFSGNVNVIFFVVFVFGSFVIFYRNIWLGLIFVGIEGNFVEGDFGVSSGEGIGVGEDEDGGDGDGKEWFDKEGFVRKKWVEMW